MKNSALSCVAACFLFVGVDALAQPVLTPVEPFRPESFPVRTVVGPDHPTVTFGGTTSPSITSHRSVAIPPGVCGGAGAAAIVGHSVLVHDLIAVAPHYDGSGTGPIPDVTDWNPHVRLAKGAQITVQGRNLNPLQLVAMVGSTKLTAMASSTSTQVLFGADSPAVGPFVVYNPGGEVRTLESTYRVFDPTVLVTSVVPTSFHQGDTVTLCGRSLFLAALDNSFSFQNFGGFCRSCAERQVREDW
jgi:hypothetical protein